MAQRRKDQPVRQRQVLRQQRAVQVRADRLAVHGTLGTIDAVVAKPMLDARERLRARTEVGSPPVILEAHEFADAFRKRQHIADAAWRTRRGRHRGHIEQPDAR